METPRRRGVEWTTSALNTRRQISQLTTTTNLEEALGKNKKRKVVDLNQDRRADMREEDKKPRALN
ncbi:MAG: hypothetical protein ACX936_21440, partial [Marinobacter sp.]